MNRIGDLGNSVASGLVGAAALTLIHESARRLIDDAPRMDKLGRKTLAKGMRAVGLEPPSKPKLQAAALAMDIIANTAWYSFVGAGRGKSAVLRGGMLGALAGVGAVVLPPYMGLGRKAQARTPRTQAMTVAWYLLGGLAAATAYKIWTSDQDQAAPRH